MTDTKKPLTREDLKVGHVYRAKNPQQVGMGYVNDRQLTWVGESGVQYNSPAVPEGHHLPIMSIDAFLAWADSAVRVAKVDQWLTWREFREEKVAGRGRSGNSELPLHGYKDESRQQQQGLSTRACLDETQNSKASADVSPSKTNPVHGGYPASLSEIDLDALQALNPSFEFRLGNGGGSNGEDSQTHAELLAKLLRYTDANRGLQKGIKRLHRRIARLEYELGLSERMGKLEPMAEREATLDTLQELRQHLANKDYQMVDIRLIDRIAELEALQKDAWAEDRAEHAAEQQD